jgi:hypothetical protein
MLQVKIIGADSINSRRLEEIVLSVADSMDIQVEVTHLSDAREVVKWNAHQLPALAINEHVVCAGRIPMDEEVASYLLSQPA